MERENLKEPLQHGTSDFPIALYNKYFDQQCDLLAPLHYHKEFELTVVTKGNVKVQLENKTYTLSKGEGVFINSGLIHMISAADKTEHSFIAIVFDYTLLCTESDKIFVSYIQHVINRSLLLPFSLSKEICEKIQEISVMFEEAGFGYEFYIKSALNYIFYQLLKDAKKAAVPVQNAKSGIIKGVIDYIRENYPKIISLQELAEQANTSKEYLCRIFNEMTDISPIVYLNRYRIQQSAFLLLDSSHSISDIALSCGFNNSSYYNKLFMRYMGCTPTEFRKRSISFK